MPLYLSLTVIIGLALNVLYLLRCPPRWGRCSACGWSVSCVIGLVRKI